LLILYPEHHNWLQVHFQYFRWCQSMLKFFAGLLTGSLWLVQAHAGYAPLTGTQALGGLRASPVGQVSAGTAAALPDGAWAESAAAPVQGGVSMASLFQPELAVIVLRASGLTGTGAGWLTRQAVGRFNRAVAAGSVATGDLSVIVGPGPGATAPRLHSASGQGQATTLNVSEPGAWRLVCLALAAILASRLRRGRR
jgi:hypothetical protein